MTNFQQRKNQRVRVEISTRTRLCEQILAVTTLVSSSFLIYRNAFLFGIALAWGVEANQYDLDAQQSEAAFAVSDVIGGKRINVPGGAEVFGDETADEDEEFSAILPWDSPSIPLPASLAAAWQRAHTPMSMETRSYLLEDVPEVDVVPTRAPENNHRRDNQHGLWGVARQADLEKGINFELSISHRRI